MKRTYITGLASPAGFALLAAFGLAAFSFAACSAKKAAAYGASSASYATMDMADEEMDFDDAEYVMSSKEAKAMAPEAPAPEPAPQKSASSSSAENYERKLIKTGNVHLEVQSLAEVKAGVESWVKKYGGYIASSDEGSNSATFTVKVPSERFEEAMGETASFGKVTNKNVSSKDVTDRYYDLKSRLETKRIMQDRLENYLKSAKDIKDMLEIESKLNDVTADLEAMQGQLNRLSAQISFRDITVYARLKPNHTEEGFTLPDVGRRFSDLASNIVYFFVGFLFVLLYVVIFGIPVLLVAALIFWLGWGKVGLVRKLFAKLKK
ncbi:MAG: DUF4349 domain-containing protein [Treponema sp.]|nr:DUF4349 domain-containing protein [Treponema sp.]